MSAKRRGHVPRGRARSTAPPGAVPDLTTGAGHRIPRPLEPAEKLRDQLDDESPGETIGPALYNTYADDPGE
ncbi:hypothetical protein [Streptomyces sp. R02]|uniref:Uncharacterized protein n=1 Tax=Streptomyces sp. R02 TaxID=3238623 RepID=A0AB39LU57_9ACTN